MGQYPPNINAHLLPGPIPYESMYSTHENVKTSIFTKIIKSDIKWGNPLLEVGFDSIDRIDQYQNKLVALFMTFYSVVNSKYTFTLK